MSELSELLFSFSAGEDIFCSVLPGRALDEARPSKFVVASLSGCIFPSLLLTK